MRPLYRSVGQSLPARIKRTAHARIKWRVRMSNKRCLGVARLVSVANGRWGLIGTAHYARLRVSRKKKRKKGKELRSFARRNVTSLSAPVAVVTSGADSDPVNTRLTADARKSDKRRKKIHRNNTRLSSRQNAFVIPLSEQTKGQMSGTSGFMVLCKLDPFLSLRTVKP